MSQLSSPVLRNPAWGARRKELTEAILRLYTSTTPIPQLDAAFTCFHPQVTFQDPLVRTVGRDQYEAQFRTLRALFARFQPLNVEVTGDVDKIMLDTTVEWAGKWYSLKLRQVTICKVSDNGMGVITTHESVQQSTA